MRALADLVAGVGLAFARGSPPASAVAAAAAREAAKIAEEAFRAKAVGFADEAGERWATRADGTPAGVDTGRLLAALRYVTLREVPGGCEVSVAVDYAEWFFAARPLLPDGADWPDAWEERIVEAIAGPLEKLFQAVAEGRA